MPKQIGAEPNRQNKKVVMIARPYCSPDPDGPNYEHCRQSLMLHKTFHQIHELLTGHDTYTEAYAEFLRTENILASLQDDIYRLQQISSAWQNHNEVSI